MWLAKWLKGDREGVWASVKKALDKFAKASVVDFTVYLIDCHLAEVAFLALEDGKKNGLPKAQLAEIEKYVQIAIKNLKKYIGIFSIGGPALNRYQGNLEWHRNKPEKALQYWRTAAEKAHVYPMKYEEARAWLELGRHLEKSNTERAAAFEKASVLFAECGLDNWVTVVKSEQ
jgi:hypothetical protein